GYKMAGAAHYAYTNDLRTSLDGTQNVTTYGVALSPAIPSLTIPVPGSITDEVNILPACRNTSTYIDSNCAIVDFKISEPYQEDSANPGEYIGTLYVNWEDSEQGGDYDQDMWGTIKYRITSSKITITTDVIAESTGNDLGFGYVISGTTDDGFHVHSGISEVIIDSCFKCQASDAATSQIYTLGSSTANFLKSPLYYAAKWGGFSDLDNDGTPSSSAEWDTTDNATGDSVSDGIPDKYFLATNPSQLESQLKQVLDSIIASTSSGTGAAVVSNSTSGAGAIYQALYQPQLTSGTETVSWVGRLNGIFIDSNLNLREDANRDGILDDYDTDKIITIGYDDALGDTFFQRYTTTDNGTTLVTDGGLESLDDLNPIWSAVEELASVSDVITQRGYTAKASNGRYIFTALKDTGSSTSMVNNNDIVDFTASDMDPYYGYMAIEQSEVADLVNYIRGDDSVANSRSRTVDGSVWRLGDIIHSSPILVSSPDAGYDDSHGDTEYGEFVTKYSDRRHMIYVGANDGMLHAFNAGFWKESTTQFDTTTTDISSVTEHNLGAELWAYVPTNLLPHLQWLKSASYPHVYYMDGVGFAQDVKIFNDDTTHTNGWGTILVMGMRFGGGAMDLDIDDDGTVDQTTGSGYVIMDITDPESAPILLAEITAPEFGYTTSKPVIVQDRSGATNDWTLVIGSGPHGDSALTTGHSDQNAKIIQVNLNRVFRNYNRNQTQSIYRNGFSPSDDSTTEANSLVGDLTVADWDEDLEDDVVYFGTSSLAGTSVEGKLMRLSLSSGANGAVNTLVNVQKPIIYAPLTGIDTTIDTNRWVMAGTGRYITSEDTLNEDQQWFFGVKEEKESDDSYDYDNEVAFGDLEDTTDIIVYSDSSLLNGDGSTYSLGGDDIDNFDEMKNGTTTKPTAGMIGHSGWKVSFEKPTDAPSGRYTGVIAASSVSSGLILFAEYVPPSEVCEIYGDSYFWALSFETGTSTYFAPLGQDSYNTVVNDEGVTVTASLSKIAGAEFGIKGQSTGATFVVDENGNDKAVLSSETAEIVIVDIPSEVITGSSGRQSWRQIDTSAF
ncbi:PilC/PilY family type IV pilus protein, partial [Psychromonas sp.]|nr:PilC/PilY family type IV pilus protein [Psychromonas sp.]